MFSIGPRVVAAAALIGAFALGGAGYAGHQLAVSQTDARGNQSDRELVVRWEKRLQEKQQELAALEERASSEIDALTLRLGQLQARVLRLDALGQRMVAAADAGAEEFDFESVPAMGGPESDNLAESYSLLELENQIASLDGRLRSREKQLNLLERLMANEEIESQRQVDGRPVTWGWVSSPYGYRTDPFTGRKAWHAGVDIAAKEGGDVISVGAGVVTAAEDRGGYGYFVEIDHGDGMQTRYAHAKKLLVEPGEVVEKGQTIALIGQTGRSTGPHVHFEVLKNGTRQNPEDLM